MITLARSARACGCDPGCRHICEGHASVEDNSVTIIGEPHSTRLGIEVSGPDEDGDFVVGVEGEVAFVGRFEAERLVAELQRRLALVGAPSDEVTR